MAIAALSTATLRIIYWNPFGLSY